MTILICGHGAAGGHIATVLLESGIAPHGITVLERDEQRLAEARARGLSTVYGDATHASRLRVAGIGTAHAVAIAVGDAGAAAVLRAVKAIQTEIRTYVLLHGPERQPLLHALGADAIVVVSEVAGKMLAEAVRWRSLRPGEASRVA